MSFRLAATSRDDRTSDVPNLDQAIERLYALNVGITPLDEGSPEVMSWSISATEDGVLPTQTTQSSWSITSLPSAGAVPDGLHVLGVPLTMVSRLGKLPKRSASDLMRPMSVLMVVAACVATAAGIVGYVAASNGWVSMVEPWASRVPPEKHILFLTDLWAHNASYAAGFVGGLIMMAIVWRGRLLEGRTKAH